MKLEHIKSCRGEFEILQTDQLRKIIGGRYIITTATTRSGGAADLCDWTMPGDPGDYPYPYSADIVYNKPHLVRYNPDTSGPNANSVVSGNFTEQCSNNPSGNVIFVEAPYSGQTVGVQGGVIVNDPVTKTQRVYGANIIDKPLGW